MRIIRTSKNIFHLAVAAACGTVVAVLLASCSVPPPAVVVVVDGVRGGEAVAAALTIERQRTTVYGGTIAARVVDGLHSASAPSRNDLAAAIGMADTRLLADLHRSGIPIITIDRPLDGKGAFCACGPSVPQDPVDRVMLAMEISDTALRRAARSGGDTGQHRRFVSALAAGHLPTHWGEVNFDASRTARVGPAIPAPRRFAPLGKRGRRTADAIAVSGNRLDLLDTAKFAATAFGARQ